MTIAAAANSSLGWEVAGSKKIASKKLTEQTVDKNKQASSVSKDAAKQQIPKVENLRKYLFLSSFFFRIKKFK